MVFDVEGIGGGEVRDGEVASVCGKGETLRIGIDGAGFGFEFAREEIVEGCEVLGIFLEFGRVELVGFQEGSDAMTAGWRAHAAPIPAGEDGSGNEGTGGESAKRVFVSPAQPLLAVDRLDLDFGAAAIEELNRPALRAHCLFLSRTAFHSASLSF